MTQVEFNDLPLCLKAWHVRRILGLSNDGLRALRESCPDLVVHRCGRGMVLYSKEKVAELAKLKFL